MKKRSLITLGVSALFLSVTSVVGYLASFIPLGFWEIFAIGIAVMVAGAILALSLRKDKTVKCITLALNAVAMGFLIRAWYINRKFDNPLWLMLLVSLLASLYLVVFILPLFIPAVRRHCAVYMLIFIALSIAGYVCLIVFTKTTWVSTLGYFGILQLGFCIALLYNNSDPKSLLTSLEIASYSVLICALIIMAIAIGGDGFGDLLGGFDMPSDTAKDRKKNEILPSAADFSDK